MVTSIVIPVLFALGAAVGSFLNVVISRYCARLNVTEEDDKYRTLKQAADRQGVAGRSICPHCGRTLRWWELVPLLSFILLRGQCHRCRRAISVQYPLVEFVTGLLFVLLISQLPATSVGLIEAILLLLIAAVLVVLFVVDLYTMLLPDLFVGVLTIAVTMFIALRITNHEVRIADSLWGIALGVGFLGALWLVTRGRGIGLGDVKIMVPLGALFGPAGTITLLFGAFIIGGVIGILLLSSGRARLKSAIPFGPFLCGMALLLLVFPALPQALQTILFGVPLL